MNREYAPYSLERSREPSNDLEKLYRSWGIFDLLQTTIDRFPTDWLVVLNIARNLLDGKPIPGVNIPNTIRGLTERNIKIDYERRLTTKTWQEATEIPSDEVSIRPIENLVEFPKVLPPYLLLTDIAPDLFTYRAISGNLPVVENQKPRVVMEDKSETVEELEEVRKVGRSMRQKVYVLFDVSTSMPFNHKFLFAKVVMMAYLAKAYEEEAQLYYRPFAGPIGYLEQAASKDQYAALAQQVIRSSPSWSGTDLGGALQVAISDIRQIDQLQDDRLATTELLLITDGASYSPIPRIPRNITLHTLHVQSGREAYDDPTLTLQWYNARVKELANASSTFTIINPSNIMLPAAERDAWLLREEIEILEQEYAAVGLHGAPNDKKLQDRVKKAREMATVYKKIYGEKDLKDAESRAKRLEFNLSPKGIIEALKDLLSRRRFAIRGLRRIKANNSPNIMGTFFDFRIKGD